MPIYEYNCPDCGRSFEVLLCSLNEKPVCPHCFSSRGERRMSCFAVCGKSAENAMGSSGSTCGGMGFK